jgi:hypothetical protein
MVMSVWRTWIIYGIKNIGKWIVIQFILFYIIFWIIMYYGLQILIIRNNHEYGVLMDYK